ncbi:hypothetical protein NA56DRAFT_696146 [Hyaloscypha hepaticicola]|uniref:Uncharacterized protein n=1 Tax=Hyaloscypha hepaticicola TaxID=2082293 RepID=A0A2J6QQ29_9HELO|nr:hypothetical protein NA56DRAFT_696146 [Hyaloscypha hepaticicola]
MQGNDAIALIIGGLTAFGLACWGYSVWYLRYLKRCAAQVRAEQERQARIRRANRAPGASVPTAPRSPPPRRASVPTAPRNPPPHKDEPGQYRYERFDADEFSKLNDVYGAK